MMAGERSAALAEELLADAYEYVLSGWCQGDAAQDECGRPIEPASVFARRWSGLGALERAWRRSSEEPKLAKVAFERARLALIATVNDVPKPWNDTPGRHQSQVLSALAQALQLVHATPGPGESAALAELLDDVDGVAHRWAIQDAIADPAGGNVAATPFRVESPIEP